METKGAADGFRFLLPAAVCPGRQQVVAASHMKDLALPGPKPAAVDIWGVN